MRLARPSATVGIRVTEATAASSAGQAQAEGRVDPLLVGIVVFVLAGLGLVVFGALYRR